jgi:hypothetical protein
MLFPIFNIERPRSPYQEAVFSLKGVLSHVRAKFSSRQTFGINSQILVRDSKQENQYRRKKAALFCRSNGLLLRPHRPHEAFGHIVIR